MTKQYDQNRLVDMVKHAEEALSYCRGIDFSAFLADSKTRRAVTYLIQIVGEAASRLSEEAKSDIDLPWRDIIGMRNILVHAYHGVDDAILWQSIQNDLPTLVAKIKSHINL